MKKYRDISGDGGSNIVAQIAEQQARLRGRLGPVRSIIAIASGKGGVGKSALTANLACCFALDGLRVGVLDADLNGPSLAKMLGVRGQRLQAVSGGIAPPRTPLGVKVMSMDLFLPSDATPLMWQAPTQDEAYTWRGAMEANALREFLGDTDWGALDQLLIDLAPGTDRIATIAGLVPALAGTVIVTIPSDVSHLIVKKSITVATQTRAPVLGLVENMAGLFPGPDALDIAREAGIQFLGRVPFDPSLAAAGDRGEPFVATLPEREAARALMAVAARIRERLSANASVEPRPA